jgi:hypothetical protein
LLPEERSEPPEITKAAIPRNLAATLRKHFGSSHYQVKRTMLKKEVPQDIGIAEGMKEIVYAVDENGNYELVPSAGWEPKNIANDQAWYLISTQITEVKKQIKAGLLSPLAYHMVKNQMDEGLLAQYVGMFKWQVKRHLKPVVFNKLKKPVLKKYASLFGVTLEQFTAMTTIDEDYRPGRDRLI